MYGGFNTIKRRIVTNTIAVAGRHVRFARYNDHSLKRHNTFKVSTDAEKSLKQRLDVFSVYMQYVHVRNSFKRKQ